MLLRVGVGVLLVVIIISFLFSSIDIQVTIFFPAAIAGQTGWVQRLLLGCLFWTIGGKMVSATDHTFNISAVSSLEGAAGCVGVPILRLFL